MLPKIIRYILENEYFVLGLGLFGIFFALIHIPIFLLMILEF